MKHVVSIKGDDLIEMKLVFSKKEQTAVGLMRLALVKYEKMGMKKASIVVGPQTYSVEFVKGSSDSTRRRRIDNAARWLGKVLKGS